jgi:hypothetical protein
MSSINNILPEKPFGDALTDLNMYLDNNFAKEE